jgi:hypothetical protein
VREELVEQPLRGFPDVEVPNGGDPKVSTRRRG